MKRFLRLTKARFARWHYLLTEGMWRGECGYTFTDNRNKIREISACRGGLLDFTITRVFFKE